MQLRRCRKALGLQPIDTSKNGLIGGLERLAIQYARDQALAMLATKAPWLFGQALGWIVTPILGFFLDTLIGFFLERTALGLALIWIAVDVQYDVKNADDATKKLREYFANPEAYKASQLKQIEENFDHEAVELIRVGMAGV